MNLRCTVHVTANGNRFMVDLANLYAAGLTDRGVDARVAFDEVPGAERGVADLVLAPHEFFFVGPPLTEEDRHEVVKRCALLTTEQPSTPWFDLEVPLAQAAAVTLDFAPSAIAALATMGVDAVHAPLGYHPSLDAFGGDWGRRRTYDATFLGGATRRRMAALASLGDVLHHRESRLLMHDSARPIREESEWFVSARDRAALVADSKVLLNVHRGEEPYFEWFRALDALSNGAVLLTEPSDGYEPLLPFRHFVASPVDDLATHLTGLLADDDLREGIAREAYEFVTTELRLADHLDPVIEALRPLADASTHRIIEPVAVMPAPPPHPRSHPQLSELDRISAALKRVIVSQIALDRRIDQLTNILVTGSADQVEEHYTPAWSGCRPDVTVVIPAFRYPDTVVDAARSALASEGIVVELVIVEDHSGDETRPVIERFLAESPDEPILALFRSTNHGLGAARNLGIRRGRAERCFMLDADNLVRPAALRKLAALLDRTGAAFAYSTIEVFGDERGLLSHLPWSVESLVHEAYIDAMAMIRRSAWEAVGGFREATETSLYGWEDYAFWLAMANHGFEGAWLPEMQCRYRKHRTSMISVTNLDPLTPSLYLRAAFPQLPWPT